MIKNILQYIGFETHKATTKEICVSVASGCFAMFILVVLGKQWATIDSSYQNCFVLLPIGATAVLVFAVPHGTLSQPWNVIAGNLISALAGVCAATIFSSDLIAAATAVGLAILLMNLFNCIHPPGGATALTAVLGGQAIQDLGFAYLFYPVLASSVLIVVLAILINYPFKWRRYPLHLLYVDRTQSKNIRTSDITPQDMMDAVEAHGSYLDISEETWQELLEIAYKKR